MCTKLGCFVMTIDHQALMRYGVAFQSRSSSGSRVLPSPSRTMMAKMTDVKLGSNFTRWLKKRFENFRGDLNNKYLNKGNI